MRMDICSDTCAGYEDGQGAFIPPRGSLRAESNARERPERRPRPGGEGCAQTGEDPRSA